MNAKIKYIITYFVILLVLCFTTSAVKFFRENVFMLNLYRGFTMGVLALIIAKCIVVR